MDFKFKKLFKCILCLGIIIGYSCSKKDNGTADPDACEFIPETSNDGFNSPDWVQTVWYKKGDTGGQTSFGDGGVIFKGVESNSRTGLMRDFNDKDVSDCKNLFVNMKLVVKTQTLAGTGRDQREAPVAVVIKYTDENGLLHSTLNAVNAGEADDRTGTGTGTRMFWKGFFYAASAGKEIDGIKVEQNVEASYSFDLMTLSPKPKTIHTLTIEGGGWKEREGTVRSLSLRSTSLTNSDAATIKLDPCALIADTSDVGFKSPDWSPVVWYKKGDTEGQTSFGDGGVIFKGIASNSRTGLMREFTNRDVSNCVNLYAKLKIVVKTQTLAGTGFDQREAPVALVVKYTDAKGVLHSSLNAINEGEADDRATTRMFWRGFYYLERSGQMADGIKVNQNVATEFSFDLMTLSPKPKLIHFVAIEGGGWKEREGVVLSLSLSGTSAGTVNPTGTSTTVENKTFLLDDFSTGPENDERLGKWVRQSWYKATTDTCLASEVSPGGIGVWFYSTCGTNTNSHTGIMRSLEENIGSYKSLILRLNVFVDQQTLSGTGLDAREAPVAVTISYQDVNGLEHTTLNAFKGGEADDRPTTGTGTRMFWRGFYIIDADSASLSNDGGVKIDPFKPYIYQVDLMKEISPRPAIIHYIAIDGSGPVSRAGSIRNVGLIGITTGDVTEVTKSIFAPFVTSEAAP